MDYIFDSRGVNRKSPVCSQVIAGLMILMKYDPEIGVAVDHHKFMAGQGQKISSEDKIKLRDIDWFFDEDEDCWSIFI